MHINFMAKRHGNLWPKITAMENIVSAYHAARRCKRKMQNVITFEKNADKNLKVIQEGLLAKTFSTSRYQSKWIQEPKLRQIFVLPFAPDRIVQHALMRVIEPIWDKLMIFDSYACRNGKGQHKGSLRTMQLVREYKYCLKADVAKFYPSVDQQIMAGIVRKKIKCKDTLWLLDDIIYSFPGGKNVPIGNYTSQWLGNLYLNELDQYLKHTHKVKAYLRYCDDICIFSNDKRLLHDLKMIIADFLESRLMLKYSYAEVFPVSHGVDFLGYRHFPRHILLRKKTALRVKRRLAKLPGKLARGEISKDQFRSSLASTRGWLKWACTHNLSLSLKLDELEALCGS